ncbi:putative amidohydrolase YtcJ [Arthrobacter roseus]|nr:putative amidohydrolase YtcJ [Arthrobacter roseus]
MPATGWVFGGRWDFNTWDVPVLPNRQALDAATGGRPAALPSIDGHTFWANTAALAAVGIDAQTLEPIGGKIVHDIDGHPTGILREAACQPLKTIMHSSESGSLESLLVDAQRRMLAVGLTGAHDFDGAECEQAYRTLRAGGDQQLRVHKSIPQVGLEAAIDAGRTTGDGDAWLRTGPVKLFADGALGSHSCHMNQPFHGNEGNTGIEVTPYRDLLALVRRAAGAGIAVATHAIGDRANQLVLEAYEDLILNRLDDAASAGKLRHRIEHTQHLRPEDVHRLARLGVVPSMRPPALLRGHCLGLISVGGP